MGANTEMGRISSCSGLSTLPTSAWEIEAEVGEYGEEVVDRIKAVVAEIAKHAAQQWPDDTYWRAVLPSWLIDYMPELSQEECMRLMEETPRERWDALPWQFDSWLDAIRERGWEWWGYELVGKKMRLILRITSIPPRLEAFKQILHAAGAKVVSEHY